MPTTPPSSGLSTSMHERALSLSTLETIKNAYSSPSACIHANWCRIPMAIVIAIALFILFTCFCCWAQCMSCCCCAGSSKKKRRSAFENEYSHPSAGLMPHSSSFGQSADLPAMPSYKMNEMKKPTYAIIGDDGSVTTEDPAKKMATDFPAPVPATMEKNPDIFATANNTFHAPQYSGRYSPERTSPSYTQFPTTQYPTTTTYVPRTSPRRDDYPLSSRDHINTTYQGQIVSQPRPQYDTYNRSPTRSYRPYQATQYRDTSPAPYPSSSSPPRRFQ